MTVKDNHPLLRKKIERFFESPTLFEPTLHSAHTRDKDHGRTVERRITASGGLPDGYLDFPHVGQVWRLTRTTTRADRQQTQTVYGLTSLSPAQAGPTRLPGRPRPPAVPDTRPLADRDAEPLGAGRDL